MSSVDKAVFEPGFGPRCPNHRVVLQKTRDPGIGICPISTARFSYDADEAEKTKKLKLNSMGGVQYDANWKVKKISGEDSI